MIDLLDLTCPMKESPNVIYALHLIELMARDSLVFIAHHKHETNTTIDSSFEDILAKWSVNGSVEAENNMVRNVNCSVLDRAPCSVGIFIDRGGRMALDPQVKLTVIHRIAYQDRRDVLDWDTIMDIEILKDVKTVADDYDLIIVSRRYGVESIQSMGLSEWSEFPELGIVRDLFASTDIDSRVSVLVVQQQHYIAESRH
ncbi:hypothetical protein GOBAR_AA30797 [Gossypium barbadense]|uniref:Uncharacterized protein n=1 Tax=Gossypium barbadense TaxID=3634 RepID=A0A2P5WFL7_GOSBA|nr:hypothetical protein GOBAR_AA30797 [Gossypium barbadense]